MINGIEILVNTAAEQISRLNCVTNNIANVNTPGFKAALFHFLEGNVAGGINGANHAKRPATAVDYSQGIMQKTGNVLDLAIDGKGFFAVQTKTGVAYTKDGRFTLNNNGELITQTGDYVLGRNGKINIKGNDILISQEGVISVDGDELDALKIVSFSKPAALVKLNTGLYRNPDDLAGAKEEENARVQSGYLELSNVQAIREMVEMINIQRTFESYQKAIQTISEQDKLSTNRIGKL
ncbi:MAG: flagellar basal-body rod protein FlgG [Desulfobacteraceae bacterium Eth-SRB1]|nr:MAG: flagellar basal-body rod protein FlgG [Desulfobacteraceae bacterium Eth-SRB1]